MAATPKPPPLYFSQYFQVDAAKLAAYGAFDISVVTDMPLFIDPFLLFSSDKPEYQALHDQIIRYLLFLRDKARAQALDDGTINAWYRFKEVRQNWFGFTFFGNDGQGLGPKFARDLHKAFNSRVLQDFGSEEATKSSHLEKVTLIGSGVGRDNVSDLTTNLIKDWLCEYTQAFCRQHLAPAFCADRSVPRAYFDYATEAWRPKTYFLPSLGDDFVLLTPEDMLTRDDTWINPNDMLRKYGHLPAAVDDAQLRTQINQHFSNVSGKNPSAAQKRAAAQSTITRFPELIDLYIAQKEKETKDAEADSSDKVSDVYAKLVEYTQGIIAALTEDGEFYGKPWRTSYSECLARVKYFKAWVENNDGYRLLNPKGAHHPVKEAEVQLAFGLVWCGSDFDLNREVNNGRGPVDFKASFGSGDKSLIEFKLASNSSLKRNLENQVKIYEAANDTRSSVKVIVVYTARERRAVDRVLKELKLENEEAVVVIDARNDNKRSASKV